MIDLEIKYPGAIDVLPVTTQVSVNIGENINALRDAILNIENVLGLDINIGLFTPNPEDATVADRLTRIERGIAERNLVFREINVSDVLSVLLNPSNKPSVRLGRGEANNTAPVTILGQLTVLAPQISNPETFFQTPIRVDVSTFNANMSAKSFIIGKSNTDEPLLTIKDTNTPQVISNTPTSYALRVQGNMIVEGKLTADFSVDHNKVLNIETVPTDSTRGSTRHVTQGDYHSHRKGRYDNTRAKWIVDSSTNVNDFGILSHKDLESIGTLPTHGNDFVPTPGVAYHTTGGDLHAHKNGDGAQIDHNDLKNINPKFSNHVTGGDSHDHTDGRGSQIDHRTLSNIGTNGSDDIHVLKGGNHRHEVDENGNPLGDGAQINHSWLSNIATTGEGALHVTNGDNHKHTADGDGGSIDHNDLANKGTLTHSEIDERINSFRKTTTGVTSFTTANFNEVTIQHGMGSDKFNLHWSLVARNSAPPSNPTDLGVFYYSDKNSVSVKLKRTGGAIPGPALKAAYTTSLAGTNNDLKFVARAPGANGNSIGIEYRGDAGALLASENLKVVAVTSPATITVFFRPLAITGITANDVKNKILSDPSAILLVDISNVSGNDGTGNIATLNDGYGGPVHLTGGADTSGFVSLDLDWTAIATL